MFVVLVYDRPETAPTVMWGEVYSMYDDALAAAEEQDSACRCSGRPWTHRVATLVAA